MSYEIPSFYVGVLPANIDFSNEASFLYSAVAVGAASGGVQGAGVGGAALVAPTLGGPIVGVLQNNPVVGEVGQVMSVGVTKALGGASFAVGALLSVTAAGKFITAVSGQYIVGIALETGALNAVSAVLLKDMGLHA